ncbi:hypothetical protein, partial [Streptomyces sp. NPDC001970]
FRTPSVRVRGNERWAQAPSVSGIGIREVQPAPQPDIYASGVSWFSAWSKNFIAMKPWAPRRLTRGVQID